jgi:hypothetical protein
MADLYWAVVWMAALSAAAFWLTLFATRSASRRSCDVLAVVTLAGVLMYVRYVWHSPRLAALLPYASLVVLGNWFLPALGVLSGLVWRRVPGGTGRKLVSLTALAVTGGYATVYPLLGSAPLCGNRWDHGVCVQTTKKSCAPACAATVLAAHGIPATEQEMAELCLTREGTTWQGLYRGLKVKTAGTKWDVQVVQCGAADLPRYAARPLILSVGLERGAPVDAGYQSECGWTPGVRHSVVLRRFTHHGVAEIADPTPDAAFEQWDRETLELLWRGTALRLVERR